jgi:hypothetical protein
MSNTYAFIENDYVTAPEAVLPVIVVESSFEGIENKGADLRQETGGSLFRDERADRHSCS